MIVVTGGAGFVGSAYVRLLLETTDLQITVLDALTYAGSLDRLPVDAHGRRLRFVHGDVADPAAVADALAGARHVVHFAAESHVDRSLLDAAPFHHANVVGTDVLCRGAADAGIERFVHISTDEVYGPVPQDAADRTETSPLAPTSPYARSKARSDEIVLAHHREGLPAVIARSSNQYGPWQFPEKLIPLAVARLLSGDAVPVYGDGLQERDWLHVDDNCAAVELVRTRGAVGTVYNVAGGSRRTNLALVTAIAAHLGLGRDRIEHVTDRAGHDRRYAMATERIHALGAPEPRPFEPALAETVDWCVANERWWRPLLDRVRNR